MQVNDTSIPGSETSRQRIRKPACGLERATDANGPVWPLPDLRAG